MKCLRSKIWVFGFLLLIVSGCNVRYARAPEKVTLRVYSDFLDLRDTAWIKRFEKEQGIQVRLIGASWDSLDFSYATDPFADLIVCRDMADACELQNRGLFFSFSDNPFSQLLANKYISEKRDLFAIAKDPYVFYRGADSLSVLTTYDELTYEHLAYLWRPVAVEQKQLVPLVTSIVIKKNFAHADGWIGNFKKNYESGLRDSLRRPGVFFGPYSVFYANPHFDASRIIYPNQRRHGAINSYVCAGILSTAPNYTYARAFLQYMLSVKAAYHLRMIHGVFTTSNVRKHKSYLESRDNMTVIERYLLKTEQRFRNLEAAGDTVNIQQ